MINSRNLIYTNILDLTLPLALPRRSFRAVQSFACSYFCVQAYALE
ncbi:hypothetical protein LF25067_00805 [Limosilactobacillus fermentum]|nr:hypothetical protein LF25067_00805 [Limosilactobacillus fermentum]